MRNKWVCSCFAIKNGRVVLKQPYKDIVVRSIFACSFHCGYGAASGNLIYASQRVGEANGFTIQMPRGTSLDMMNAQSEEIETLLKEAKNASGQPIFSYSESIRGLIGQIFTRNRVRMQMLSWLLSNIRKKLLSYFPKRLKWKVKYLVLDLAQEAA